MGANNKIDNTAGLGDTLLDNLTSGFSGIISTKPMAKYLTGARCVLRMNGKIVGFAFGISWNIETDVTEINTIDDYLPYELAPSRITVTGTVSGFRIPGSGPGGDYLQANIQSFPMQRYVEIEVRDSTTNNLIFLTKNAMITSRSENVKSGSLADMTLNFKAIGFADELSPERLKVAGDDAVDVNGTSPVGALLDKINPFS